MCKHSHKHEACRKNTGGERFEEYAKTSREAGTLTALLTQGHSFIERVVAHLQQFELLDIQQNEIPILATNMWIINRYWIDYCQLRSERQQITEQDVQEGIQQVRSLIIPYLTPLGRQVLNRRNETTSAGQ